jgi:hypothetical protein
MDFHIADTFTDSLARLTTHARCLELSQGKSAKVKKVPSAAPFLPETLVDPLQFTSYLGSEVGTLYRYCVGSRSSSIGTQP